MTLEMGELESLIDLYCEAWSDPDPVQRAEILATVLAKDATYTDPLGHARGADELLAHIAAALSQWPGAKVLRTSRIDMHHGMARFTWQLVQQDGTALPDGLDIVDITSDGKIGRIVGFFGPLRSL